VQCAVQYDAFSVSNATVEHHQHTAVARPICSAKATPIMTVLNAATVHAL
jgi:hypothetical protein